MPIALASSSKNDCCFLRLRSCDFYFFDIPYSHALHSGFLKRLLAYSSNPNNFPLNPGDVVMVNLDTIDSFTLKEVIKYIELLDLYKTGADLDQVDKLMSQFLHQQRNEESWEKILAAADFLEI